MELNKQEFIQVKDKKFRLSITAYEIQQAVSRIARQLTFDLDGKNPLFLVMLNGAFMFAADLMKQLPILFEMDFVRFSSYEGLSTTGSCKELMGLTKNIENRTVVVVEDIVDTGYTMQNLLHYLEQKHPAAVKVVTFCSKPEARKVNVHLDYVGLEVKNIFLVGYGLDYDGYGRNYDSIYSLFVE